MTKVEVYHDRLTETPDQTADFIYTMYPQYRDTPLSLIPWPYRHPDFPEPTHCPICGRALALVTWFAGDSGYAEMGCSGWLQPLQLRWRSFMLLGTGHFRMALGRARKVRKTTYDPMSGRPMDR